MKRRTVLKAPVAGLAPQVALDTRAASSGGPEDSAAEALPIPVLLKLRERYRYDLFDDFLPFLRKHVIDQKYGGFMCSTDRDGTNLNQTKRTWDQGRGVWVYSFLYNHFGRKEAYLEVARQTVEFLLKWRPSNDNELWPKVFSRQGKPLSPPDSTIYGDLFIAQGLAEYSKATGSKQYWDEAHKIVRKCVRIYDQPDYDPEVGREYLGPGAPSFPGARLQVVWLVLLHTVTQMLQIKQEGELQELADRCVDALVNYHHHPGYRLNGDFLNHDLSRPDNDYAQVVHFGAAIEALWMLLYEAARRRDRRLFERVADRFRHHVEVAWDRVYGGVFEVLENVDANLWTLHKYSLVQEEVLIGSLFIVEHLGFTWAKELFDRMYEYVQEKFPLKRYGYPLWILMANRKVDFEKHADRVENYRHPRHLMYNLLAIDRMIQRGGRLSGIFA
jgi:mannose/cellobiose epimerase-like protein (N-acyl-D-glucosamine 2-epimerase family)